MRILLDECVHAGLRRAFPGHAVSTVPQVGWGGVKNGKLLGLIAGQFDVFVTIDQNIAHQQNLADLPFALLFVSVPDNTLACYLPLFDAIFRAVEGAHPGDIIRVPKTEIS